MINGFEIYPLIKIAKSDAMFMSNQNSSQKNKVVENIYKWLMENILENAVIYFYEQENANLM